MTNTHFDDNFVQLPRGSFLMGSDDPLAKEREKPLHEVHIDYDVAMSKKQVTVEDYMLFAQATGAEVPVDRHENLGFDVPVRRVRFHDAKAYCEWKTQREGKTYRLPTEAEWEYACRAGSNGKYCYGDEVTAFGDYAWYTDNSEGVTHDVGTKKPNAWGLYDMHGNVWEWCEDWYVDSYKNTPKDGTDNNNGSQNWKVLRGSPWNSTSIILRSAFRFMGNPSDSYYNLGFRVVLLP